MTGRVRGALAGLVAGALARHDAHPPGPGPRRPGACRRRRARSRPRLAQDNNQLNSLGEQYLTPSAPTTSGRAPRPSSPRGSCSGSSASLDRDRVAVAAAAIGAYVNAGSTTDLGSFLVEKPDEVAGGADLPPLRRGQAQLGDHELPGRRGAPADVARVETHDAAVAKAALARTTAARAQVVGTLRREQQLYDSVQGQLARLVAAQLAARSRPPPPRPRRRSGNQTGPPSLTGTKGIGTSPIPRGSLSQDFAELRNCEASGDYQTNTGNGYYGAYQFALSTWLGLGETGLPCDAPPSVQDAAAYLLYQRDGWHPWPACSAILGL